MSIDEEDTNGLHDIDGQQQGEPAIEPASDKPVDHVIFVIHVRIFKHDIELYLFLLISPVIIGYWTGKFDADKQKFKVRNLI